MKKIALLEDDNAFRESIREALEATGSFVCTHIFSRIGELQLNRLEDDIPDMFWLDISLPDGNSIPLITAIKAAFPATLCLICSIHEDDEKVFEALKAGADGYLLKGASIDEIKDGVYDLFQGGAPMSPYIARKVLGSFRKAAAPPNELEQLTGREMEVLSALAHGYLFKEVADKLFISQETVKKHVQNIYRKLHVQNRSEAIIKYLKHNL